MADQTLDIHLKMHREQTKQAAAEEIQSHKTIEKSADQTSAHIQGNIKQEADARRKATKEAVDQAKQQADALEGVQAAGGKLINAVQMIGSAFYGIQGVSSVVQAIAESFERARNQAEGAGKFVNAYKEALKEIAYLKGQPGPTSATVFQDLGFRQQTLQDQASARAVQEEFRNMAGVSMDTQDTKRKMSQADAEKAMIFAGRMQSMYGGDGGAYGKLAGIIPGIEKSDRVSGEDASRRMAQLLAMGEKGGASPSQFAAQMAGSASLVTTGAYKDVARMGAIGATLSIESPGEISTGLDQLNRLSSGSLRDITKPPGADMSPSQYLQSLGATGQMDDPQILDLMMSDAEAKEKEAAAKGEGFNVRNYLQARGYGNMQDRGRFAQLYGRRNDYRNTFSKMAGSFQGDQFVPNMPSMADANRPFNQFLSGEKGMSQAAQVSQERVMASQGLGAQEYYQALEKQAFAVLSDEGHITGTYDDWKNSRSASNQMAEILRSEGVKSGLDLSVKKFDYGRSTREVDPLAKLFVGQAGSKERADAFYALGQQIAQKGGSPLGMNSDQMKKFNENLDRTAKATEAAGNALMGINDKLNPAPVATVPPGGRNAGPIR